MVQKHLNHRFCAVSCSVSVECTALFLCLVPSRRQSPRVGEFRKWRMRRQKILRGRMSAESCQGECFWEHIFWIEHRGQIGTSFWPTNREQKKYNWPKSPTEGAPTELMILRCLNHPFSVYPPLIKHGSWNFPPKKVLWFSQKQKLLA